MAKIRFSLRFLILIVTAIVLFLGYSQWRRHKLLSEYESFKKDGALLHLPSDYVDYIWQRRPDSASVYIKAVPWGPSTIKLTDSGINKLHDRLEKYGISKVTHYANVEGSKVARPLKRWDDKYHK